MDQCCYIYFYDWPQAKSSKKFKMTAKNSIYNISNHFKKINFKAMTAFLLLLIFLFPSTIQYAHSHVQTKINYANHNLIFVQKENECAICQFEFVSFIQAKLPISGIYQNYISINFCSPIAKIYTSNLFFASLRAPPFSI